MSAATVALRDVTPRDGLQDHGPVVPTDVKAELVRRLWAAGVDWVEATSFVSPKRVPQLADAAELCAALADRPAGALLSAFAATVRGAERALDAGVDELSTAVPASDGMSAANFARSTAEMLQEVAAIRALAPERPMSATIAVAFGCPYDGRIEAAAVTELALALAEAGYDTILLGDTIGVADPARVEALVGCLVAALPHATIGAHFHDARGAGVANVVAAVRAGARMVDTALGGLGGCPFAPGAAGNVATEDVVWTLRAMGVALDARPQALTDAAHWMRERLAVELRSRTPQATRFDWERDVA